MLQLSVLKMTIDIATFIDQIVTCQKPNNDPELLDLVNRQTHRHPDTCCKKSKNECTFHYPQPPMKLTRILYSLDDSFPQSDIQELKVMWKIIKKLLNELKEGEEITQDQLTNLNVSQKNYILAIQSSFSCP